MIACSQESWLHMHTDVTVLGIFILIGSLYLFSERKGRVIVTPHRTLLVGLAMQVLFAAVVLNSEMFRKAFLYLGRCVMVLRDGSLKGAQFVFGYLGGGDMPFEVKGNTFIFLFQALPVIFVVGALSSLLFHWGLIQKVVAGFAFVFSRLLRVRGALALCAGAKMFLGQTDAPLLVRPYLQHMTRSEMFATMSMGMATTSVTVLVLYASILEGTIPNVFMHIITSTVMAVPVSLAFAHVLVPAEKKDASAVEVIPERQTSSAMEAIGVGMYQAKDIVVGISLSLVVFIAFIFVINKFLGVLFPGWTLEVIMGYIMAPLAWLLGFSGERMVEAGSVLGQKVVFNEIFAFSALAKLMHFSEQDRIVLFYASNGFANVGSIGIVVSAWNVFVPKAKKIIPTLAVKSLLVGVFAALANAMIVRLVFDVTDTVKAL